MNQFWFFFYSSFNFVIYQQQEQPVNEEVLREIEFEWTKTSFEWCETLY